MDETREPDKRIHGADYWQDRYVNQRTGWDRGGPSPSLLERLEQGDLKPCRIVVPGSGHGHEVLALARAGFEVTAIDFAATPVQRLRKKLEEAGLSATVVQGDVVAYQPDLPFDAIYEQTCLCALAPPLWEAYENQLFQWLVPAGKLYANFMQVETEGGPPYHCDIESMQNLFSPQRWRWDQQRCSVPHPSGITEISVVLQKDPDAD